MWYLFPVLAAAALLSGILAAWSESNRKLCFAVSVMTLIAAAAVLLHLLPLTVRSLIGSYLWGSTLVASFFLLRSQVRRILI